MELQELLQKIDALQAEINALRPLSPELEGRIMQKFRLDWNFHSSNIEGNSLTFGETKTFLLHGLTAEGKPLRDHLEIKGHNEAIHALDDIVHGTRPLTEHAIKSFHQIILGEPYQIPARTDDGMPAQRWVTPGKYKSQPNHVRTATGETFYFASPENTPSEMERLMEWYNNAIIDDEIHPLVTAAVFHYQFIRIHPFDDGNGRIARILMNLVLMMRGYPPVIIRTEDKGNYYRALRQADGDDIDAFVGYVGEQLVHSQEIYLKGARGEWLEELDDIDKKIALFKATVDKGDQAIREERTDESVRRVFKDSLIRLFSAVLVKLSEFDELFMENCTYLDLQGAFSEEFRNSISIKSQGDLLILRAEPLKLVVCSPHGLAITKFLADYLGPDDLADEFAVLSARLKYEWKGYKHLPADPFTSSIMMIVSFDEYLYSLSWAHNDGGLILGDVSKPYHQILTDKEIQKVATDLAEHMLEKLQKRTR